MRTQDPSYADCLVREGEQWWKRLLDVQRPYRMHVRRLGLGFTLDVGCGIGRNLAALGADRSVGVDHNPHAVEVARRRGFVAYTPDELTASSHARPGAFDALLASHVLEHMSAAAAAALLRHYLPYVRAGGRVVVITPQEAGFRSDPTHVEFMDPERVRALFRSTGIEPIREYSFPLPRIAGHVFKYNEFVSIGRVGVPRC